MVRISRFLSIIAAVWVLFGPSVAHAQDPTWWDTGYAYRQKLTLAAVGSNLADFPLMVKVDASRMDAYASSDGTDVRFVIDNNGTLEELPSEMERWNSSGTSIFWVQVPTVSTGGTEIWMYWGNSAPATSRPGGTWNAHYMTVWHMETLNDSTSTGATLTEHGTPTQVDAAVGRGRELHGSGDYYSADSVNFSTWLGNPSGTGSLEFWIKTTQAGSGHLNSSPGVTGYYGNGSDDHAYWGQLDDAATPNLRLQYNTGAAKTVAAGDGAWHYVAFRHNGKAIAASMDGAAFPNDANSGNFTSAINAFNALGFLDGTAAYLIGTLDEVRIRDDEMSSDYVSATYLSETDTQATHLIDWCDYGATPTWYADVDGDRYGDLNGATVTSCSQQYGYVGNTLDCADDDATLNPDTPWYADDDLDGYGDINDSSPLHSCTKPTGPANDYTRDQTDHCDNDQYNWTDSGCTNCGDPDLDTHPSGCDSYADGVVVDQCEGTDATGFEHYQWNLCSACVDSDTDGDYVGCDNYDGSFVEDCNDSDGTLNKSTPWYLDSDYDGYGGPTSIQQCVDPSIAGSCSYVDKTGDCYQRTNDDCSDTDQYNWTKCSTCGDPDMDTHLSGCDSYDPNGPSEDQCEGADQNGFEHYQWHACNLCQDSDLDTFYTGCDAYDAGFPEDCNDADIEVNPDTVWYPDSDNDGEGAKPPDQPNQPYNGGTPQCADPSDPSCSTATPTGLCWAPNNNDCDDHDPTITSKSPWYPDADYDHYGDETSNGTAPSCTDPSDATCADSPPTGTCYVRDHTDCDDGNAAINPDTVWYLDSDADTYGSQDPTETTQHCTQPAGYVSNHTDCDDNDVTNHTEDDDGLTWAQETSVGADDCSNDSDGDHVHDDVEWGPGVDAMNTDPDVDDIPDIVDPDDDGDGVPTADEDYSDGAGGAADGDPTNDDTDQDGKPDYLDVDDDGDTIDTIDEDLNGDGDPTNDNFDGDLLPNYLDPDDDNDRIPTAWEVALVDPQGRALNDGAPPYNTDSDADSIPDKVEWGVQPFSETPRDTDGDGTPDILDTDDDNDGIATYDESPDDLDGDAQCNIVGDGLPSYRDVESDGDGWCDGTYQPTGNECKAVDTNDPPRDPLIFEDLSDYDNDGVANVNDCDDLDFGVRDTDGDGLSNADELTVPCYTDTEGVEHCLDPQRRDTNGDGVPDGLEVGSDLLHPLDTDGDGIPDWWDFDDDGDHILTIDEDYTHDENGVPIVENQQLLDGDGDPTNDDTDGDGTPDYLDTDDDGDGILTIDEDLNGNGNPADDDIDGDFLPDYLDANPLDGPLGDLDGDGVSNSDERSVGSDELNPDTDLDGVIDGVEWGLDSDGDLTPDVLDTDDDGDGIPTAIEGTWDADGDGTPNYLDLDSDGDGKSDAEEGGNDYTPGVALPDSDGDGTPDFLDPLNDPFDTGGSDTGHHLGPEPGCACTSVPAPASGLGLLLLLGLAGLRRRRRSGSD